MKVFVEYLKNNLKRAFEYKTDFFMGLIGLITINLSSIIILVIIANSFTTIGGWTIWEVIFNYSLFLTGLGLHKLFFRNIVELEKHIIKGTFDRFLLRPFNPFFQLVLDRLSLFDNTDFLLGIIGLVVSIFNLEIEWGIWQSIGIIIAVLNSALVFTLILTVITTMSFWIFRIRAILYGTSELQEAVQNYPITIYNQPLKFILTYILPYAATNYYPTLILLGKEENKIGQVFWYLILIDIVLICVEIVLWKKGVKSYQSSGS